MFDYNKKKNMTKCENKKILNPETGRCVSKTGAIGIKLLKNKNASVKSLSNRKKSGRTEPISMKLQNMTLLTQKPVKKTQFAGNAQIIYKCIKYLGEKHKDKVCIIKNQVKNSELIKRKKEFAFVWNEVEKKLVVPKTVFKEIENCEKRFVVCHLTLKTKRARHANILIFDKVNKTVERFDPHGEYMALKSKNLDEVLTELFRRNLENFKYITPLDFCPNIAFQRKENKLDKLKNDPGGFCAAWAIWYADMRLTYPDIPIDKLVDIAIDKIEKKHKSFKNFIRNYSQFLIDTISKKSKKKPVRKSKKSSRKPVSKSKKSVRKSKKSSRKPVRKSKKSSRKPVRKSKKSNRKPVRKSKKSNRKPVRKSKKSSKKSVRKSKKSSKKSVRKSKKSSRKSKKSVRKSKKSVRNL